MLKICVIVDVNASYMKDICLVGLWLIEQCGIQTAVNHVEHEQFALIDMAQPLGISCYFTPSENVLKTVAGACSHSYLVGFALLELLKLL